MRRTGAVRRSWTFGTASHFFGLPLVSTKEEKKEEKEEKKDTAVQMSLFDSFKVCPSGALVGNSFDPRENSVAKNGTDRTTRRHKQCQKLARILSKPT
jgi:hypothetical protein